MIRHLKIEHIFALALISLGLAAVLNYAQSPEGLLPAETTTHLIFSSAETANESEPLNKPNGFPDPDRQTDLATNPPESVEWLADESSENRIGGILPPYQSEVHGRRQDATDTKTNGKAIAVEWNSEATVPLTIDSTLSPSLVGSSLGSTFEPQAELASTAEAKVSDDNLLQVTQAAHQRKNLKPYRPKQPESADPFAKTTTIELNAPFNSQSTSQHENNVVSLDPEISTSALPPLGSNDQIKIAPTANTSDNQFQPPASLADQTQPAGTTASDGNAFNPSFHLANSNHRVPAKLASAKLKSSATPEPVVEPAPEPRVGPKAKPKKEPPVSKNPRSLQGADSFVLAKQPKLGDHWKDDRPITDQRAYQIPLIKDDFSPDPNNSAMGYDPYEQMDVYEGKTLNSNQRPILELGRPWYQLGQLSPGSSIFGKHNQVTPQFLLYGDWRTAVASNSQNGDNVSQIAFEVNLDFDLKITSTERFHMFMSPLDDGQNTGYLIDDDEFVDKFDADIDFGYFEGDLGAIVGGFTNQTLPFDLPFAVGVMPLLLQNGVWMEDAFLGVAATVPARNSARLGISNMDITFFAGYDKINSPAFAGDDSAARMYGMASFIEAMNGYLEIDYAFFDDRTQQDRSYHNLGIGFTRRFGRLVSNSTRVIVNAGQQSTVNSADGVLLLSENSLITRSPSTLVPYMNFFAGFDRPQSAARAAAAGGVLRNTGILFESDGMTGYPTLDPTANDTFGGALGLNLLADDFSQQLVLEMAALGVMNEAANRNAAGAQYGVGFRYQLPISNAMIIRMDGMYGFLEDDKDVRGLRLELRHKY